MGFGIPGAQVSKHTILLVDDDEDIRDNFAPLLEARGYLVICAGSGDAAITILDSHPVDFVVSDLLMPNGNGLKVRARAQELGIPLIFATGYEDSYKSLLPADAVVLAK